MAETTPSAFDEKVDVVIAGAGAAGSYYARRLARAGKSVVVLEPGPAWTTDSMVSNQLYARRLKWGGGPVEQSGQHKFPHNMNTGWGLGGAALHHYATWPRLRPEDFRMRELYGRGFDWPMSYEDLRPHYDRIQEEYGIAGDAEQEISRPEGDLYPLPPIPLFPQGEVLKRGFDALGLHTAPQPMAILTDWYKDREPCIWDGWCDAGCPTGALANPLVTDIPWAKAAGAEFRTGCTVARVIMGTYGKAEALAYHTEDGSLRAQPADLVVLAANSVQIPRILFNSAEGGLANGSDTLGRYFMLHAYALLYGLFEEDTAPYLGVSGGMLSCRDGHWKDRNPGFGAYSWQIAPAMKTTDLFGVAMTRADVFGQAFHDFMKDANRHIASMASLNEEMPQPTNRVTLAGEATDRFGMPLAHIHHSYDADAMALWDHTVSEGLAVMEAAGARERWQSPMMAPGHMTGGTIMGDDPETSLADGFGVTHEVRNLVIGGSGLFPTSAGVNPTYTIYALASRSADQIVEHWSDYAG